MKMALARREVAVAAAAGLGHAAEAVNTSL